MFDIIKGRRALLGLMLLSAGVAAKGAAAPPPKGSARTPAKESGKESAKASAKSPDGPPVAAGPAVATSQPATVDNYQKSTPEQDAAAIKSYKADAAEAAKALHWTYDSFETDHFLVFTDWDPREKSFLQTNLEAAYRAVSHQFDIPVKENVFVGKLPVYMFAKQSDFQRFLYQTVELQAGPTLLGIYAGKSDGSGFLTLFKPAVEGGSGTGPAERRWARTLTHEFTHAFIARYRTNRRIPRWLNEGTAEVIADGLFPSPDTRRWAALMAGGDRPISNIFDDDYMPPGEYYPVMQTMVQALVTEDRRKFLKMFDAIKAGTPGEKALKAAYGVDYAGLEQAWRKYMTGGKGRR